MDWGRGTDWGREWTGEGIGGGKGLGEGQRLGEGMDWGRGDTSPTSFPQTPYPKGRRVRGLLVEKV